MGNKNSGPPRRPHAVQVLHGVTRKDRLNPNEPKPPKGPIERPEGMSSEGQKAWDHLAPVCMHMGTLTTADIVPFATMCELQATFTAAAMAKDGQVLFKGKARDRYDQTHIEVVIDEVLKLERETATTLKAYYEYFGLTPGSRARLAVMQPATEPRSKWDEIEQLA